jgi:hypothetical protein
VRFLRDRQARPAALASALVVLLAALLLARQAVVSAWDTIWAEDGFAFLSDALSGNALGAVVEPHGGYIHPLPRAAAAVAAMLPLDLAAVVFSIAWALVVASLTVFVYAASDEILRSRALRLALAALTALLPAAGSELLGNTANLHFYLVYACFWAFVWRRTTSPALIARATVVAVTALSDPLTLLFAPLAVWNAVSRRGRRELVVPASLLAGLAVQLGATALTGESPERLTRFDATDLPLLFALRVTGSLLVGDRFLDDAWLALGRVFAYGALLAVGAALVAGAVTSGRATRLFVAVAAGYAVVLFGVFLAGRGTAGMRPGMDEASWHLAGARFTYAPILLLAAALLALVDRHVLHAGRQAGRLVLGATVAIVAVLVAANFDLTSERSLGPAWQPELEAARERCDAGANGARIPVAPEPFGFVLEAACRDLR